jgi:ectoine hydroxylase-related dioxygenase (phytanoyl-CoA dioxygenase family)
MAHRDYHLGFQNAELSSRFPRAMHVASSLLTLQGAVAHIDMSLASGPARFLPYSQTFEDGFMAYRRPKFSDYFEHNCVSLPLRKGDAVFFNPALFHAAGENKTPNLERSANLLQISSAFGKTMESIDTQAILGRCWAHVAVMHKKEGMSLRAQSAIKAVADGYAFPTNLDKRPPAPGGIAPESEQDMLKRALTESWTVENTLRAAKEIRQNSLA